MKIFRGLNKDVPPRDAAAAFICVGVLIFSLLAIHVFEFKYVSEIKTNSYVEIIFLLVLAEILNLAYKFLCRR